MLERESLEDIPGRLRLPVQANPSDRVDLSDRHIYIFGYEAMPSLCHLLLVPLTVHLILAVAHCSALTSLFLIGSKIMHLHCCRILIVVLIFFPMSSLAFNLVITHYYLS